MSFFDRFKTLSKKQDIDDQVDKRQFKKLSSLFIDNPEKAIEKAEKYLIKSKRMTYEQFIEEVKATQKSNCCTASWSKSILCGQCFDCQNRNNTCFCIPCFLAGHHDQHNSIICYSSNGSCDCGNPSFINPSGFCPNHPGPDPNPDVSQMTPENRKKFITVFEAAYYAAMNYKSEYNMEQSIKFISQFISYGDGLRRCASYAVATLSKRYLYKSIPNMSEDMVSILIDLFGQLVSDMYFLYKMSYLNFLNTATLINKLKSCLISERLEGEYLAIKQYMTFEYHYYVYGSICHIVHKTSFNWPDFLINLMDISLDTLIQTHYEYENNFEALTLMRIMNVRSFLESVLSIDDQHENIQNFIDKYSNFLIKYERLIPFCVRSIPQDESDEGYNLCNLMSIFGAINSIFTKSNELISSKNKQFSVSKVVSSLINFCRKFDIKPESILNEKKKTKVALFLPLHHLFYSLLQNHENTKDLMQNECRLNNFDFNEFCSVVLICPLRAIAASVFQSSKFIKLNHGFSLALKTVLKYTSTIFCSFFGLVQTLIGISTNKEKMMENVLITFGVFDDLNEYKKTLNSVQYDRQTFLNHGCDSEASIFFLSLLTDSSIITLDSVHFNLLRVIELLKKGRASADEIKNYVDSEMIYKQCFTDNLEEYVERVMNKKGDSYFQLKNEGDFTPFYPPISVNNRANLLVKFKDNLAPVLEYSELPRQISLKQCFRSPSFIAMTHKMLLNDGIISQQVGFCMFISIVKNGETYSPQSFDSPNPIAVSGQSLNEVISKLDEVGDRLNEVNVLTIQIQLEDKKQTSILQLVQGNKQLGKLAIEKTGLSISFDSPEEEKYKKLIQEKKAKAALFKQRLMKEYQNRQKQFGTSEQALKVENKQKQRQQKQDQQQQQQEQEQINTNDDDDDFVNDSNQGFNNTDIICNVCLTNQDDILGFPCLSIRSHLPMIIENKLHKIDTPIDQNEFTFELSICGHHIHFNCYKELLKEEMRNDEHFAIKQPIKQFYHCMTDRGIRNCLLPLFDDEQSFTKSPSILLKMATDEFINRAFNERAKRDIKHPMTSFAYIVLKLEVRHRNRPECLDSKNVPILLHNLLLTLYHGLHQKSKSLTTTTTINNPTAKLVFEIVKSDDPVSEFTSIVNKIASELNNNNNDLFEFLRRAAIIEDLAVNNIVSDGKFIDWDDVLSLSNLLKRYHIINSNVKNEIELPVFETIKLPEKFIHLYLPPYNMEIFESNKLTAVDLITGQVVRLPKSSENNFSYPLIDDHALENYMDGLSMYLCLTGKNASCLLYHSNIFDKGWKVDGFYTDKFGDVDPGFKRGIISTLNKDKLDNALDTFLSGDLVLY